jgi:hypothetical protein
MGLPPSSWREDADPRDALWRPDLRNSASGITHGPTRRNGPRCNRSGSACIPCRERFTRRPAISQCGGLRPGSRYPWRSGGGAASHLPHHTPERPSSCLAPSTACPVCQRARSGGAGAGTDGGWRGRVSGQCHHSGDPSGPSLRTDSPWASWASDYGLRGLRVCGATPQSPPP